MAISVDLAHLSNLISIIKNAPPDLVLISENGSEIRTWKLLVSLFSKSVAELLQNSDHATALSCPVKKNDIDTLLNVLENHNHDDDIIGNEAFGILGIEQLDITNDIQFQSVSKIDPNHINTSVVDEKPTFVEEIHQ